MTALKISYNGEYPNLCRGTLCVEKNGKTYEMKYCLSSGGRICRSDDWDMWAEYGEWSLNDREIHEDLKSDVAEILKWVNENVEEGCCGGCI